MVSNVAVAVAAAVVVVADVGGVTVVWQVRVVAHLVGTSLAATNFPILHRGEILLRFSFSLPIIRVGLHNSLLLRLRVS